MIYSSYKTAPLKKTVHNLDIRQIYDDPTALINHILLHPGESLRAHETPVDVSFYVLEGTPTIHVGEESIAFEQDTLVQSPANIVHYLSNESTSIARILVIKAPKPTASSKFL